MCTTSAMKAPLKPTSHNNFARSFAQSPIESCMFSWYIAIQAAHLHSHIPFFSAGLIRLTPVTNLFSLLALWMPLCRQACLPGATAMWSLARGTPPARAAQGSGSPSGKMEKPVLPSRLAKRTPSLPSMQAQSCDKMENSRPGTRMQWASIDGRESNETRLWVSGYFSQIIDMKKIYIQYIIAVQACQYPFLLSRWLVYGRKC